MKARVGLISMPIWNRIKGQVALIQRTLGCQNLSPYGLMNHFDIMYLVTVHRLELPVKNRLKFLTGGRGTNESPIEWQVYKKTMGLEV